MIKIGYKRSVLRLLARLAGVGGPPATDADRQYGSSLTVEVYGEQYGEMRLLEAGSAAQTALDRVMTTAGRIEIRPKDYFDSAESLLSAKKQKEVAESGDDIILYSYGYAKERGFAE